MASLASLVSLGRACTFSPGQFEGSLSSVRIVSLSTNFGSFRKLWVGKRWRYVSVCKYSVTTDYIADQGASISLDSTYRGSKEDDADLILKPSPKPVLRSGPKVDPLLGMNSVTWDPSKFSGDSEEQMLNGEEEERNKVIESLGEVLEKAEKLETSKKATASVRKPPTPNTRTDGRPVNTTAVRKSKTLKSAWRKGNPVATVQKVVKELPKNEKVEEPNTDVVAKSDSPSVDPLRPPQPPLSVQPKLQMRPSVAPPPPMIKKPVILKDVGAATKSSSTLGTNLDAKTKEHKPILIDKFGSKKAVIDPLIAQSVLAPPKPRKASAPGRFKDDFRKKSGPSGGSRRRRAKDIDIPVDEASELDVSIPGSPMARKGRKWSKASRKAARLQAAREAEPEELSFSDEFEELGQNDSVWISN